MIFLRSSCAVLLLQNGAPAAGGRPCNARTRRAQCALLPAPSAQGRPPPDAARQSFAAQQERMRNLAIGANLNKSHTAPRVRFRNGKINAARACFAGASASVGLGLKNGTKRRFIFPNSNKTKKNPPKRADFLIILQFYSVFLLTKLFLCAKILKPIMRNYALRKTSSISILAWAAQNVKRFFAISLSAAARSGAAGRQI